jgi:hypothetical protein
MDVKLKDLLKDGVYIKLKDGYRNRIFQKFLKKFKNKKLASKFLNLSGSHYINAYQNNKFDCPFLVLYKIAKYINKNMKNITKNIELIKVSKHGKYIKKPKFPSQKIAISKYNKPIRALNGQIKNTFCYSWSLKE